jgi:Lar family restriction alleviation protein
MSELLPCPFCGGEVDIEEIPGNPFTNEPYTWAVGCKDCNIGWYKETKEDAIATWNRRANLGSCENELIVRCENCKHYNRIGCSDGFGWCESMDRGVSDDFYCANGAKMESEVEEG